MLINLKILKTSNKCPVLGVEPDKIFLIGRENSPSNYDLPKIILKGKIIFAIIIVGNDQIFHFKNNLFIIIVINFFFAFDF